MLSKLTGRFSVFHLIAIALMAGAGIAVKAVIVPLVHVVTGPLYIPGGAVAGGIYMLFLVLGRGICGRFGAGFLTGLTQAVMVMLGGISGSHGVMSLITYALPGLAVDLVFLISRRGCAGVYHYLLGGIAANLTGSLLVNMVFFNLPFVPLMLSLTLGAFSGGLGGVIAWKIKEKLDAVGVLQ